MHKQRLPTKLDNVLLPRPIAAAVAAVYGRHVWIYVVRSAWQLGRKVATSYQRFPYYGGER